MCGGLLGVSAASYINAPKRRLKNRGFSARFWWHSDSVYAMLKIEKVLKETARFPGGWGHSNCGGGAVMRKSAAVLLAVLLLTGCAAPSEEAASGAMSEIGRASCRERVS